MMRDAAVVAVSPARVYRILQRAGLRASHNSNPSRKGNGFVQPLSPPEHGHVDISYRTSAGTFYDLCRLRDGCRRFMVPWEIRETMTEADVPTIIQRARALPPGVTPRSISDNGPQCLAKDFKEFIRICGMTPVRTSPYSPQSTGTLERFQRTIQGDGIRPGTLPRPGGCPPPRGRVRRARQQRPLTQRHRLGQSPSQTGGPGQDDLRRARPPTPRSPRKEEAATPGHARPGPGGQSQPPVEASSSFKGYWQEP